MRKKRKKVRKVSVPFPLRQILQLHGCSQRQLAKRTGIDEQRVSDLANGRHAPTWPTILRIMTAIGGDLGDLAPAPPRPKNSAS